MYRFLRPLLFQMGAEQAHRFSTGAARWVQRLRPEVVEPLFRFEDAALYRPIWGLDFKSPVGLAAGFDKNAELVRFWEALGFGFAEVGSVTARPAEGNARPRAFRLEEDRALVNRLGLGNEGADAVAGRLEDAGAQAAAPLGINIAKTPASATGGEPLTGDDAVEDYRQSFRRLAPHADYVTLNVSCPNTLGGGTFEEPDALDTLLEAVFAERERMSRSELPVLIKLSPPETDRLVYDSALEDTVAIAQAHGIDGFVAANTAPDRAGLSASHERLDEIGAGGLSGPPVAGRATALVRYLYRLTGGEVPIIGVGGVDSAQAAYEKIRAGASLVQLYTGLVYEGPGLVKRIKEGLAERLAEDGFGSVAAAVGADAEKPASAPSSRRPQACRAPREAPGAAISSELRESARSE
ncbi:MAG: quinone-dependent dihydroorotate dehydrogenase [Bacteroidetes bacterium QS_9_68_14]|nr:MAG: quinone-dependent dihydroorotate dehydrogenase [Bacteroidetes bacterium QS_9_68_14]